MLVHTNCEPVPSTPFEGGTLILECSDYRLFDEALKTLTIKKLKELSLDYWTKKE
ncbi:hypothetical protein [Aureispira anguillae]|uniref:Uncharacterized protein n=1 Tax=Aureispira anguillae TaxID=2864201 RepID=A0A915YC93_9BACT|nr:hypothetical protein [Aureispira anguillae]BDS10433.1 hypothetical protein AsAng_0011410 [Aureispira anguillae]